MIIAKVKRLTRQFVRIIITNENDKKSFISENYCLYSNSIVTIRKGLITRYSIDKVVFK
jgi:hypothetical protein